MYYAKYIKYKNKYLNIKYQLGGEFETPLKIKELRNKTIPEEVLITLEPIDKTRESLENNLVGIKVLYKQYIDSLLSPLVQYNKKFKNMPIYFYSYKDNNNNRNNTTYIICSLYDYWEILNKLQKKNIIIRRLTIDKIGNVSLKLKNINIPKLYELDLNDKRNLEAVEKKLKEDLIGIKVLESNLNDLQFLKNHFKKQIYFYRYTDTGQSYVLCSSYEYYEFLNILTEDIKIEEIDIESKEIILKSTYIIYHLIDKPDSVSIKKFTLDKNDKINTPDKLIEALNNNPYIIIKINDENSELLLSEICMYNLFTGTIHIFIIYDKDQQTDSLLLSLFTEYELIEYIDKIPPNINFKECRLYRQGDKIEFILNKNMIDMMFCIYSKLKTKDHYSKKLFRGNPKINNKFLNELDSELLVQFKNCVSVKDITFNTTLWLKSDKISDAINHNDILKMEKDFIKNKFKLINSNNKLYSWMHKYEDLIQLWEYNLEELEVEINNFKKKLLELEECHKELLVIKLNEKGFIGNTMVEILENSVLCYLKKNDQYKKLLYEYSEQKDKTDDFIKNCKFIPEIKKLVEKKDTTEIYKYRQTILMLFKNNDTEKKYRENRSYFFAMSWFDIKYYKELDKVFSPLDWTVKLNKLTFQCLSLRDMIIFPLRIINYQYLESPLSYEFDNIKQEFIGYLHTRFTDNYNGNINFNENCRDKFYFIYQYTDHKDNYTGKTYRIYYYTGNPIWLEISMLPYYKIFICEINWIYYTFILKYNTIPHFYEYINDYCEKEIVVSRFSLDEIRSKYKENEYNLSELDELKEVFYNYNYYKRENETDTIFIDSSLLKSIEEQKEFIDNVFRKNKILVK